MSSAGALKGDAITEYGECSVPGWGYHSPLGSSILTLDVKKKVGPVSEIGSEGEYEEETEPRCDPRFEPGVE